MVAILGWIMPAPLAQPSRRTERVPRWQRAAAHFARVSVVMMARVNPLKSRALRTASFASNGTARSIFSTFIGRPMTPVEQTITCSGSQLIA